MEKYIWKSDETIKDHINKHIVESNSERKKWGKTRINDINNLVDDYIITEDNEKSKTGLWHKYTDESNNVIYEKGKRYIYSPEKAAYSINYESAKDKLTTCIQYNNYHEFKDIVSCFYKPNTVINCGYWLFVLNELINKKETSMGSYMQDILRIKSFDTDDESYIYNLIISSVDLDYSDDKSYKTFLVKTIKNTFIDQQQYWAEIKENNKYPRNIIKSSICGCIVDYIDNYCLDSYKGKIYDEVLHRRIIKQIHQFLGLYIDDIDDQEYKQFADAEFSFLLLALFSVLDGDKDKYEKEINSFDKKFKLDFKISDRFDNARKLTNEIIELLDYLRE